MKTINLILVSLFILTAKNLCAQSFEVPKDYQFVLAEDYAQYEKSIIEAAKWLKETPSNEQIEKRKDVSAFVVKWINGSPSVSVEINETIMNFDKKNEGMLVLFMASSAKYVLENNYSKDIRPKQKAALHDMISVYKTGKGIQKDKNMDKLIKSDADGKLDAWIDENLKMN
ncbi:MAG: hypothetical protein ABI723_04980 [Bacteroidia bacterium]